MGIRTQTDSGFLMIKKDDNKHISPDKNIKFSVIKKIKGKVVYEREISRYLFEKIIDHLYTKDNERFS